MIFFSKDASHNKNILISLSSGQPKPEVTSYKNGQTIDACGIVSSCEFFENQYVHLLHLYW